MAKNAKIEPKRKCYRVDGAVSGSYAPFFSTHLWLFLFSCAPEACAEVDVVLGDGTWGREKRGGGVTCGRM